MPATSISMLAVVLSLSGSPWAQTARTGGTSGKPAVRAVDPGRSAASARSVAPAGAPAKSAKSAAAAPAANRQFVLLSDSYIETNEPHRLYDPAAMQTLNEMGVLPLRVIYATIDENRYSGLVDAQKIVDYVKKYWGPNPSGYFMLDYEIPYLDNLMLGLDDPTNPKYVATSQSMLAAIQVLRQTFPNAKWTYYGVPGLQYYFPAEPWPLNWAQAPQHMRDAEVARRLKVYAPLIEAVDWVSPCHYDIHEAAKFPTDAARKENTEVARIRITTAIEMARSHLAAKGLPAKPIIPLLNLHFGPGGNTEENRLISIEEIMRDQAEIALAAKVDGIAFWSAVDYYILNATRPDFPDPNTNGQKRVRKVYKETLLGGKEPQSWSSTLLRADLLRMAGQHMIAASAAVLAAAKAGEGDVETSAPQKKQSMQRDVQRSAVVPAKRDDLLRSSGSKRSGVETKKGQRR